MQAVCPSLPASPLVGVFQAGYAEINAQFRLRSSRGRNGPSSQRPPDVQLSRAWRRSIARCCARPRPKSTSSSTGSRFSRRPRASRRSSGSSARSWGIIIAFNRIGATGSTNLAIVGAGISEALIATAAGLFAAIPAVYFYNHLTTKVKSFATEMDDFSLEFLNIAERNFT